jgi:sulfur carrier protein
MPAKGSEAVLCRCTATPLSCNPDNRATAFLLSVAQWLSFGRQHSKIFFRTITGNLGFLLKEGLHPFLISESELDQFLKNILYSQTTCFLRENFVLENRVKLTINGKEREVHASKTVTELVKELQINAPNIAVALNHQVIPKSQYSETPVKDGDNIEIVHAVGGGV